MSLPGCDLLKRTLAKDSECRASLTERPDPAKCRGEHSAEEDPSIGGHLLRVRDEQGGPLPFARLWSELSIFFMAGMETTAHAATWAL